MVKSKNAAEAPPLEVTPPADVPSPPELKPFPIVDNTPEPPPDYYPDVVINNDPNAVVATEAEKAQGIAPKNADDAPRADDFPAVEIPSQ